MVVGLSPSQCVASAEYKALKLVCIIPSLNGGGAERVLSQLASMLAKREHDVTLITLDDGKHDRHLIAEQVRRLNLDVMTRSTRNQKANAFVRLAQSIKRLSRLRSAFREIGPDVILSFCDQMNVMTLIAASRTGIPVVACERSDPRHQSLSQPWEWLRGSTYPNAFRVVALTQEVAEHLQEEYRANTTTIASAIASPPNPSPRDIASQSRKILAMGRLEHEKGFDRLIEAFGKMADKHPDWMLSILGDGSQREALERQISELHLTARVTLHGWLQDPWKQHLDSCFFVLPSRYEGFPSALLEAMCRGIPALTVDCDSGPRAITHRMEDQTGHPGAMITANDSSGLVSGLEEMISNPAAREEFGRRGVAVTDHFGWEHMVSQFESLLREAASDRSTS